MLTLDLEEAEHVMFLKFVERLRLIWRSRARDVLQIGWISTLDLRKRNMWGSWSWSLERKFVSSKELQSSIFEKNWSFNLRGKLESLKKFCIFKGASIFEDSRLQDLGSLLVIERILSGFSEVKNFQPLQMRRRISLFIEFTSGLYGLEHGWSMDQTHGFNHIYLCFI